MPTRRPRVVHTYGTVCKVELIIYPNSSYTGIFQSGGIGLARLSMAKLTRKSFIQGLALKIFIDGNPSQNLHVLSSPDGQYPDRNYFAKSAILRSFRNIIPQATSEDPGTVAAATAFAASLNKLPGKIEDNPESVNVVTLVDLRLQPQRVAFLPGHATAVNGLTYSKLFFFPDPKNTIRLWSIKYLTCLAVFGSAQGHRAEIISLDVDIFGAYIVSGSCDSTIKMWNPNT
ncbi:hypothetical protein RvY_14755 [Ramazzottius varieornatus]|uniref:Uncharacterized protein n=1 Tax=Ramazzottius varieornatus TaxID=947166 RepID=A0A1D1VSF9_RAMVA|nr:hypothetical protein RvY_14755 [Ramazzottius varieornatus]